MSKFRISSQRGKERLDLLQVTELLTGGDLGLQVRFLVVFFLTQNY